MKFVLKNIFVCIGYMLALASSSSNAEAQKKKKMKTITKLLLVVCGFTTTFIASTNHIKASNTAASVKECHGSGICFVTAAGTTIYGHWCEHIN
jgi:hypothetical protein